MIDYSTQELARQLKAIILLAMLFGACIGALLATIIWILT